VISLWKTSDERWLRKLGVHYDAALVASVEF